MVLILIFAAVIWFSRGIPAVQAQDETQPVTDRIFYGMSGLPTGHIMRVNVTSLLPPPTNDLPPGPTRVVINFRNGAGQLVRNTRSGNVIQRIEMLESGESAFFDLDADLLPPGPSRYQVRPVITVQYALGVVPPDGTSEHKPMVSSVEIFNGSSPRTVGAFLSGPAVIRGFNPQPDPPSEP
jgi:hypothetical protein